MARSVFHYLCSDRATALIVVAGIMGACFAPAARAGAFDKVITVRVSAPVEVPGKLLSAGDYVFEVRDNNFVQVLDRDESHVIAKFFAIPQSRMEPVERTTVQLEENPGDLPESIRGIFCQGDVTGLQFLYPKNLIGSPQTGSSSVSE